MWYNLYIEYNGVEYMKSSILNKKIKISNLIKKAVMLLLSFFVIIPNLFLNYE